MPRTATVDLNSTRCGRPFRSLFRSLFRSSLPEIEARTLSENGAEGPGWRTPRTSHRLWGMHAPVALTRSGPVIGTLLPADESHSADVARFRGIPFAQSIAGANRFRAPQREHAWTEARDCNAWGDICPQVASAMEKMLGSSKITAGNDCLNLNVWTPAADDAGRPVMVWITVAPMSQGREPPRGTTGNGSLPITTSSLSR